MPEESKSKSLASKPSTTGSITYADAGVDIARGDRAKDRIKYLAQKTFNRNVLGGIGGFGPCGKAFHIRKHDSDSLALARENQ